MCCQSLIQSFCITIAQYQVSLSRVQFSGISQHLKAVICGTECVVCSKVQDEIIRTLIFKEAGMFPLSDWRDLWVCGARPVRWTECPGDKGTVVGVGVLGEIKIPPP